MAQRPAHTFIKDSTTRFWTGVHESVFRASNGRVLGDVFGMPVVMLTTTGRKTGKKRTKMLTSPLREGDGIILVASYGGDDRHPTWFLNLRDNPDVEVMTTGKTQRMIARVASPDERAKLWPRVVKQYRGYGRYQERTKREIPLVILEPAN
jgi:deazaflavin-dependent oxidoreductase (nitroreductase family)